MNCPADMNCAKAHLKFQAIQFMERGAREFIKSLISIHDTKCQKYFRIIGKISSIFRVIFYRYFADKKFKWIIAKIEN